MRLILHNPHITNYMFWKSVLHFLTRDKMNVIQKYGFLIEYMVKNNIKFGIFIDKESSSFPWTLGHIIKGKLEVYLWLKINKIPYNLVEIITDEKKIHQDDVVFSFLYFLLNPKITSFSKLKNTSFLKLFHATHYLHKTSDIAKRLEEWFEHYLIIAEANLSKNSEFFKKFFHFYTLDTYVLPFSFSKKYYRYQSDFRHRINKCLSTWTVHFSMKDGIDEKDMKDYLDFFWDISLHPIRKEIYEHRNQLKKFIDNYMSPRFEKWLKNIKSTNHLYKLYATIWNWLVWFTQKKYFSFNIVEKFNQYKMFICGEEIIWLPAISTFEGMACWWTCIAKKWSMYEELWMKAGIHYIWHNWTLEDVIEKIEYYQNHTSALEKIANNWYDFIQKNLNEEYIAKTFLEDLHKIAKNNKIIWNNVTSCSFIR